jgi:hypothetical protein
VPGQDAGGFVGQQLPVAQPELLASDDGPMNAATCQAEYATAAATARAAPAPSMT